MKIEVPQSLRDLASATDAPLYIVGGYVRNQLAGLGETDIDLCGPLSSSCLKLPRNYFVKVVNFKLSTAVISDGVNSFEYTPFRLEKYPQGGEHMPAEVLFTSDVKKDALRRDFTVNSIYYDIRNDEIVDFVGGVDDIKNKIIRALQPDKVFASDGLRIMRLVRQACELNFKIDGLTARAAQNNIDNLRFISAPRKREELDKILVSDTKYNYQYAQYRAVKLLYKLGAMEYIIPQLLENEGVEQNEVYHKYDVLEHTFQTVKYAAPSVRLAALLHDIGKGKCVELNKNMHGHENLSAFYAREIMSEKGLMYSNAMINEVERLVASHMYDSDGKTNEAKVRRFIVKNWDIIDKLILLIKADRIATGYPQEDKPHRFEIVKQKIIDDGTPLNIGELNIGGQDCLDAGIKPQNISTLLKELLNECIITPKQNNREWLMKMAVKWQEKL